MAKTANRVMLGCGSVVAILLLSIGVFFFMLSREGQRGPIHRYLGRSALGYPPQRAVDAAEAQDWNLAYREASRCVAILEPAGLKEQERLEAAHTPLPVAAPPSQDQRIEIMRRGTLNSLGHCYLIRAEAQNQLGRTAEALDIYARAARLTYARVYDSESKTFWSPAERADAVLNQPRSPNR